MVNKKVKFETEYKGHKRTLYGTLYESRGVKLVKSGNIKNYSPMGWKEVKVPKKLKVKK